MDPVKEAVDAVEPRILDAMARAWDLGYAARAMGDPVDTNPFRADRG